MGESYRAYNSVIFVVNTLSAKDGDLRLSASNVFVTECVFFTSTCYKLHNYVHIASCAVQLERRNVPHYSGIKQYLFGLASLL